jgi:flavin reductase (DIM6/NTAB) family NADH-FMN oxidoreductase RutF
MTAPAPSSPDEGTYDLLRYLTLPVVAVTSSAEGRRNGMIANSAQRASLVPSVQRISLYVSKTNFSHGLIYASGVFGLHLLRTDQWALIRRLGVVSGRSEEKLGDDEVVTGVTGVPLLRDCRAAWECTVVNAMDAGAATFFLGEVRSTLAGAEAPVMTSDYFRAHMPEELRRSYEANLARAQEELLALAPTVTPGAWPGPTVRP